MTAHKHRYKHTLIYTHVYKKKSHTLQTNLFEKWQKSHTVIRQLTTVILVFLISTSHRQKWVHACSHRDVHTNTHFHYTELTNAQNYFNTKRMHSQGVTKHLVFLQNKRTFFFSSDEALTANANEYKHKYDGDKDVCSYGVILASKTVGSVFSGEQDTTCIKMMFLL